MSQQDVWDAEDAEMRRAFAEKDAEIARLKAEVISLHKRYSENLNEIADSYVKDAEIARLNGELLNQVDRRHWLENQNESQRKLIGELADWITEETQGWTDPSDHHVKLIQRAREGKA